MGQMDDKAVSWAGNSYQEIFFFFYLGPLVYSQPDANCRPAVVFSHLVLTQLHFAHGHMVSFSKFFFSNLKRAF